MSFEETTPAANEHEIARDWESYREVLFAATQAGCVRVEKVDDKTLIGLHLFAGEFDRVQTTTMQDAMNETPVRAWVGRDVSDLDAQRFALECLNEI
jgi:hypothetical protein